MTEYAQDRVFPPVLIFLEWNIFSFTNSIDFVTNNLPYVFFILRLQLSARPNSPLRHAKPSFKYCRLHPVAPVFIYAVISCTQCSTHYLGS